MAKLARVVVTGMGTVSPLGSGAMLNWQRLLAGHSGLVKAPKEFDRLPGRVHGRVPFGTKPGEFNPDKEFAEDPYISKSAHSLFLLQACKEALKSAKWAPKSHEEQGYSGVIVGNAGSSVGESLEELLHAAVLRSRGQNSLNPSSFSNMLFHNWVISTNASLCTKFFNLKGPTETLSTACATGVDVIGQGFRFIRNGDCRVMLCAAVEAPLHPHVMAAFSRMGCACHAFHDNPTKAARPFDRDRQGVVVAEGAAAIVIEDLEHALRRGAHIYGEILGYGHAGDAHHITTPAPDGDGVLRAMKNCLADTRGAIKLTDVEHVNCHGSSSKLSDKAESIALMRLFDSQAPRVRVSATKGSTGHPFSAAGTLESIFTLYSCEKGVLPHLVNLENLDPEIQKLKYRPQFVTKAPQEWNSKRRVALKISEGFGGANAVMAFSNFAM